MKLRAAVFDFGETLLSEERAWGVWADWIGVTHQELFAAFGATVAGAHPHVHALELCRPGFDLERAFAERAGGGRPAPRGALRRLSGRRGRAVAAAGGGRAGRDRGQPAGGRGGVRGVAGGCGRPRRDLRGLGRGEARPAFFARLVAELGLPAGAIAYVGDRVDNDIVPAAAAGLFAVHLRRGPWGIIQAAWPEAAVAVARAGDLDEAVDAILASGRERDRRIAACHEVGGSGLDWRVATHRTARVISLVSLSAYQATTRGRPRGRPAGCRRACRPPHQRSSPVPAGGPAPPPDGAARSDGG